MREGKCGFRWPSELEPTRPHECIRKKHRDRFHVCYCGEDSEKLRIERMIEAKNKL